MTTIKTLEGGLRFILTYKEIPHSYQERIIEKLREELLAQPKVGFDITILEKENPTNREYAVVWEMTRRIAEQYVRETYPHARFLINLAPGL